jgi:hypothetical protein
MSELKFTKGKWETDERCNIWSINEKIAICCASSQIEDEANALLISKAPEMLEMLKKLVERLEENDLGRLNAVSQAKQLIKEATQL